MAGKIRLGVFFVNRLDNDRAKHKTTPMAYKVSHIKERLLDEAVILFNWLPFQNGNLSKREEIAPRGSEFLSLRAVPYGMKNHFYHMR